MPVAQIQPVIKCELDPTKPVPEICAVIMAVVPYHPGQEDALLLGVQEAIQRRRDKLKGDKADG